MNFGTDTLDVWINGFFVLAAVSGLLSFSALVMLLVTTRSTGGASVRRAHRLPALAMAQPEVTTDRAA